MSDLFHTLFGPLSRSYCTFFYIIAVIAMIFFLLAFIPAVYFGITRGQGLMYWWHVLTATGVLFVSYFQARLLYSMCSKSL